MQTKLQGQNLALAAVLVKKKDLNVQVHRVKTNFQIEYAAVCLICNIQYYLFFDMEIGTYGKWC